MNTIRTAGWTLLLLALVSAGCSSASNNKGKIEGTKWENEATTIDGKELAAGDVYLEFTKDGKLHLDNRDGANDGTYTLGAGDQVIFNFEKEFSGSKKHVETIKINGDKLTLSDSKGTLVFNRIPEEKFKLENTVWYNEAGEGKGKFGDLVSGAFHLDFGNDGSLMDGGKQQKIGTYTQGPGETFTINFTEKFMDTEWKSKNIPVTDKRNFTLTDVDGNTIKFKRSG